MHAALRAADDLLRAAGRHRAGASTAPFATLAVALVACGLGYGAAMGSWGVRPLQSLFSGLKVPLLLAATTAICLPSFWMVNTLLGLRADTGAATRAVVGAQGVVAIALAALAPMILFTYASITEYTLAVLANGAMFAVASLGGQLSLARHYRALIARDPRHRIARDAWLVLYVFVAIQMAWVLRPFIGSPDIDVRFFRPDAWSNAYVVVARLIALRF